MDSDLNEYKNRTFKKEFSLWKRISDTENDFTVLYCSFVSEIFFLQIENVTVWNEFSYLLDQDTSWSKILDPDPKVMILDPQHWLGQHIALKIIVSWSVSSCFAFPSIVSHPFFSCLLLLLPAPAPTCSCSYLLLLLPPPAPTCSCSYLFLLLLLPAPAPTCSCSYLLLLLPAPAPTDPAPTCSCPYLLMLLPTPAPTYSCSYCYCSYLLLLLPPPSASYSCYLFLLLPPPFDEVLPTLIYG